MKTLILNIEYDGTKFNGWQIQPNGRTIQEEIEKAILRIFNEKVRITGAGRTDSGVHAINMTASCQIENNSNIPNNKIIKALNTVLPDDIAIINSNIIDKEFNARFDAIARSYYFYLHTNKSPILRRFSLEWKIPFDKNILFDSAKIFLGIHDFTTFSKINASITNNVCEITISEWEQINDNQFRYHIKGYHFLYGMVRCLVGGMLAAARGNSSIEKLKSDLSSCNRKNTYPLVAPEGLHFEKAYYNTN